MLLFCRIIPLFFLLLIPCIFFGQDDDANLLFIDELSSNNVANAENLPLRILEIPKGSIDLKTVQPKDPEVLEPELFSKGSG
ncbi:MAG: hypothetical protein KJN68_10375, partial [Bacteroidia bacterium]|nr:hypothetical protein [Bacteroidia bacterium]